MAELPIIDDVFRVAFQYAGSGGVDPVNVLHFRAPGHDEDTLCGQLDAAADNAMFVPMAAAHTLLNYSVIKLDGESPTHLVDSGVAVGGTAAGQGIPNMAIVVSLRSARRGRSGRGRVYLGPITEDINQGAGIWTTGGAAAVEAAWEGFFSDLVGHTIFGGVASYALGEFFDLTDVSVSHHIRSCRSRLKQTA